MLLMSFVLDCFPLCMLVLVVIVDVSLVFPALCDVLIFRVNPFLMCFCPFFLCVLCFFVEGVSLSLFFIVCFFQS